MGDNESKYIRFVNAMRSGIKLPDPAEHTDDGITIRKNNEDTCIDLMLDSKFRIRMNYAIKNNVVKMSKGSFIPDSSAKILYERTVRNINRA